MEIIKIPILDFFKYSLDSAYERGFIWVMCLLARDADAEETYQQVKSYWDSFHDLTGKIILFVFAGKQSEEKQPTALLRHEAKNYRALTNPSIRFVGDDAPTLPHYMYPSFNYETYQMNDLAVTHTRSITELRDFFGLSEIDVPSLVFVPTHPLAREKRVVIKLRKENLYQMVKKIVESLEEPLIKLKKTQDDYAHIDDRLTELNHEIKHLQVDSNIQNRFSKAKSYLVGLIQKTEDDNLKLCLQDIISNKIVYDWHRFDHQTRAYLNQYLDLLKRYPTLDNDCHPIVSQLVTLECEQRKVNSIKREMHDRLTLLHHELAQVIQGIKAQMPNTKEVLTLSSEHPKAFVSYSWEDDEHKTWVKSLVDHLISDGIDATLDQYDLSLGDRLPQFMEKSISDADYVLIICTPTYKSKSDSRKGGVGYEGHIISAELLSRGNERKFIPVIRKGTSQISLPTCLSGKLGIDLTGEKSFETNENYKDLITTLYGIKAKPQLGIRPSFVSSKKDTSLSSDLQPIQILGIITDEVTVPKMDGTRGSALYKIPFRLSKRPNDLWCKLFVATWNSPPRFTSMHRPGIASVYGDKIVLDGTTIEEVRDYHRETLILCVDEANRKELQILAEEQRRREREENRKNDHYTNVNSIADKLEF